MHLCGADFLAGSILGVLVETWGVGFLLTGTGFVLGLGLARCWPIVGVVHLSAAIGA